MPASNYLEQQILDHLLRTGTFGKPAGAYVALFTSDPGDDASGTEVTGGSYARVAVTQLDANWNAPVAGNGQSDNVNIITFPAPTANWGIATHWALFDAASAGNLLIHGALTTPKTINNGDPAPKFPAGTLVVTVA